MQVSDLGGQPTGVRIGLRGSQVTDPLILLTPGKQLPPDFFIHKAIAPDWHARRKANLRHRSWAPLRSGMWLWTRHSEFARLR
jgi:hypothetical protein